MKNLSTLQILLCVGMSVAPICAQITQPTLETNISVRVFSAPVIEGRAAVAVTMNGKCEASTDGTTFSPVKQNQILAAGTILKTGENGRVDLYFKGTGVALRLQKDSELKIAKMGTVANSSNPSTELKLVRGQMLTLVRGSIPGSFVIENAQGLNVTPSTAVANTMIVSASPVPVSTHSVDLATVAQTVAKSPGQSSDKGVNLYLEFDELQALAEKWTRAELAARQ
jgi:hypothetical protein